jgi:hypothetical protein
VVVMENVELMLFDRHGELASTARDLFLLNLLYSFLVLSSTPSFMVAYPDKLRKYVPINEGYNRYRPPQCKREYWC